MTHSFLSVLDPALLEGTRDHLAEAYSAKIFAVIPDVSEFMEFGSFVKGKSGCARASGILLSGRRNLQTRIAALTRLYFDRRMNPPAERPAWNTTRSLDTLSLLDDGSLDDEIALNHCARRLKEQCQFELWGLTQRLCMLIGVDQLADKDNPLVPHLFAQVLMSALGELETNNTSRLAMFKTFGPVLIDIIPEVYAEANHYLTTLGIDIEVEGFYGAPVVTPPRRFSALSTPQEIAASLAPVLNGTLQQLMALADHRSAPLSNDDAPLTAAPPAAAVPAWSKSLQQIESGLANAPQQAGGRALHNTRAAIRQQMSSDEQVIVDVVTVMFDKLHTDPRIPDSIKAAVSRLQVPVLETALRDSNMLSQTTHPVQKLIDLVAEFGMTVDDVGGAAALHSITSVIDGLIRAHASGQDAFEQAYCQLDDLFYHHEEAALQRDQKVRSLERGELLERARQLVAHEINVRMQDQSLPATVNAFILNVWREVLIRDYMSGGPKGMPLKLGLATLDQLLLSLRPAASNEERRGRGRMLQSLIELLRDATEGTRCHPELAFAFFAELQEMHARTIRGEPCVRASECVRFVAETPTAPVLAAPVSTIMCEMDIACGDWFESGESDGNKRWRLNWVSPMRGMCVLKHYESRSIRTASLNDLRDRLNRGEMKKIEGLGLVKDVMTDALAVVARKLRRESAAGVR